jgi:hypothetical protein
MPERRSLRVLLNCPFAGSVAKKFPYFFCRIPILGIFANAYPAALQTERLDA